MSLPIPPGLLHPAYAPLVALLRDTLLKPKDVAQRHGQSEDHLAACRRRGLGLPFIRLPGTKTGKGSIRYRLSDVIHAEVMGSAGPLSLERVCLIVAGVAGLSDQQRALVIAELRRALG